MTASATPEWDAKIGILWRGSPAAGNVWQTDRINGLVEALAGLRVAAEPVMYSEEAEEEVRRQLLQLDGVLVWVDPVSSGRNRTRLDALLREVSEKGVWVSAHPDVIQKMGNKEVLYRTCHLSWGTDTYLYSTAAELGEGLPLRLASGARRVLKPNRGNGGIGVWRVELAEMPAHLAAQGEAGVPGHKAMVRVQQALRDSPEEHIRLGDFLERCARYFDGTFAGPELVVDQPFQERLGDGMIRCYLVQDRVAGFTHQFTRGLMPPPPPDAGPEATLHGHGNMYGASEPVFQPLRAKMESEWVPALQGLLDIDTASLPAIWDADFLYGPKTESGEDTYVLCEINISAVFPFPAEALEPLAGSVASSLIAARQARR